MLSLSTHLFSHWSIPLIVKIPPFKILYRMLLPGRAETTENLTSEASTSSNETVPFVFLLFFLITSNIQAALLRAFHRNMVLLHVANINFLCYLDSR
jgi:hypothetical protein